MRHPSPPFLRTLNTYVRFARVFRAANCCCAVSCLCGSSVQRYEAMFRCPAPSQVHAQQLNASSSV